MYDENGSGCSAGYDVTNKYLYIVNNATDGSWGALYHTVPPEKLKAGTYTLCFHEKLISHVSLLAIADDTVTVLESAMYEPDENGLIVAHFTLSAQPSNRLLIAVYANQGVTVAFDWAALYEGEYTADNLPPYVPKGYTVELMECMRYYEQIPYTYRGTFSSAHPNGVVWGSFAGFKVVKRVIPTVINVSASSTGWYNAPEINIQAQDVSQYGMNVITTNTEAANKPMTLSYTVSADL